MEKNESRRIWVFDPANNTDHEAGGLRGKPITPPEWAENRGPGWASPDLEGSGPRKPRRVRAWMVVVAVIAVIAIVLAGLGVWQAVRVRGAVASCESMSTQATAAGTRLTKLVQSDEMKDAEAITADQVEDPDTVTALKDALRNADSTVSIGACTVDWYDLHPDHIVDLPEQAKERSESTHRTLRKAMDAVVASRDAKTLTDATTALKSKTDQASTLLKDSDGRVQDNATRDALGKAIDQARKLLDAGDDAQAMNDASAALDQATAAVSDSVKAKSDADAKAAAEAAAAQAAQQAPSYTPSYTPSYSGGGYSGGGYTGGGYTPSYSGGASSGGSASSGGGSSSIGGIPSGAVGGTGVPGGDSCVPVCIDGACQPC